METYNTGYISTGKLQAETVNIYPDTSGSISASLRAVEVNVDNLTASTINVEVFNFQQANLDVSGNLTVGGDTLLNNLHVTGIVQLDNVVTDPSGTGTFGNLIVNGSETIGKNLDVSGNVTVKGDTLLNNLHVTGTVQLDNIVTDPSGTGTFGNLIVNGSETIGKNLDVSGNVTVKGDTLLNNLHVTGTVQLDNIVTDPSGTGTFGNLVINGNTHTSTLDVSGNTVMGGSLAVGTSLSSSTLNVSGFTVDASGNMNAPNNVNIVNGLNVSGGIYAATNSTFGQNLAVMGNEYIGGQLYANCGVAVGDSSNGSGVSMISSGNELMINQVDFSGNVLPANVSINGNLDASSIMVGSLEVTGPSMLYDVEVTGTANINILDVTGLATLNSLSVGGTTVDASGDLIVAGTTTVNSLETLGTSSFEQGVNMTQDINVSGGLFVLGGVYANANLVVGDTEYGDGVTLESSGNVLEIFGVTQDLSANLFPINVNVGGSLAVTDASGHSTQFSTVVDSSGMYTLGLNLPDSSGVLAVTAVPHAAVLPIVINGVTYYIALSVDVAP